MQRGARALLPAAERGLRAAAGAAAALRAALEATARAAPRARGCCAPTARSSRRPGASPASATALAGALFLHRWLTVQSRGEPTREVDWVQSAGMLVRRDAASEVGLVRPRLLRVLRRGRLRSAWRDAGWSVLYVPGARAIHREQLSTGGVPQRRIVEFSRNRDRYMRKHHGARRGARARADRLDLRGARLRGVRAARPRPPALLAATSTRRCPRRGEGLREAARDYNRGGTRL